ncbi:hypothetical protein ACQ4PT_051094 [Festuca glaucescens]
MELCSVASIMSLGSLAIQRTHLCSLVFRVLPKLLGFTPSSLKKLCKDVDPPLTETIVGTSPELAQDVLMNIFTTLEIPDLIRAGAVCPSGHSAYTSLQRLGLYKLSQTPCLLYTSASAGDSSAYLYSLSGKRSYKLLKKFCQVCPTIRSLQLMESLKKICLVCPSIRSLQLRGLARSVSSLCY